MMQLWEGGPQRQADLAKILGTDAATMTRTVRRLERGGFVRKSPSPTDKRSTIIEATPASMNLRDEVRRVWEALEESVSNSLSTQDRDLALTLLERMELGLEASLAQDTHRRSA